MLDCGSGFVSVKRARIGTSAVAGDRQVATFPYHVWALAIAAERPFTSDDMVRVLGRLVTVYGTLTCIRMDNGTAMTAHALRDWHLFARTGAISKARLRQRVTGPRSLAACSIKLTIQRNSVHAQMS
jgi:hypothetical protein